MPVDLAAGMAFPWNPSRECSVVERKNMNRWNGWKLGRGETIAKSGLCDSARAYISSTHVDCDAPNLGYSSDAYITTQLSTAECQNAFNDIDTVLNFCAYDHSHLRKSNLACSHPNDLRGASSVV
jgi:hypothetical protein